MSYEDGWAAMNLEMPPRVPRVEFDAAWHPELVKAVTGIDTSPESPHEERLAAAREFMRAWDYDTDLVALIHRDIFGELQTEMGHAEYAAGGTDFVERAQSPFKTPEEVLAFDPWEAFGKVDQADLTRRFEEHYRANCEANPTLVNTTGIYPSLLTGLTYIFGWEMLLVAAGTDPEGFGEVANRDVEECLR